MGAQIYALTCGASTGSDQTTIALAGLTGERADLDSTRHVCNVSARVVLPASLYSN
jgi:hypothetical protein